MVKTNRLHMLVVALFLCFILVLIGVFAALVSYLLQDGHGLNALVIQALSIN